MSSYVERAGSALEVTMRLAAELGVEDAAKTWYRLARDDDPARRAVAERGKAAWGQAQSALEFLASIADERAAAALRDATGHRAAAIRAAAWTSLAWSGTPEDTQAAACALTDTDGGVRHAAIGAITELAGDGAADALAAHLDRCDGEEQEETVWALAWLRDRRALALARVFAAKELAGTGRRTRYANGVRAVLRIGNAGDVESLASRVLDEIRERERRGGPAESAFWPALNRERPEEARDFASRIIATGSARRQFTEVGFEPLLPRTVPRLALVEPTDGAAPVRFGGQPDWLETPQWPITADGRPLVFYGQLPLQDDPRRMGYVFVSGDDRAASWAPLGEGNALIVQPGGRPHLETRPTPTGPQLWERTPKGDHFREIANRWVPVEHRVALEPGHDPAAWSWPELRPDEWRPDEHGAWNKIGGTPLWLQGDATPPGEGWEFAFQFTAGWAGEEMGDGAECYGFLNRDGTASFGWDCH